METSDNTTHPNLDPNQKYFHCGIGSGDVLLDTKETNACNNPNWGDQVYKINKGEFHTIPIYPFLFDVTAIRYASFGYFQVIFVENGNGGFMEMTRKRSQRR